MSAMDLAARGLALAYRKTSGAGTVGTRIGSTVEDQLNGFATRAGIRALDAQPGATVQLLERGRESVFTFFDTNNTYAATFDPEEGLVIAPDSDPTGASGTWLRVLEGNRIMASWFGWHTQESGTTNLSALQAAIQAAEAFFSYEPQGCAVIDLGNGSYDLGAPGDSVGVTRIKCHIEGHGPVSTQIVWKGDPNATVVRWDSHARGHFTGVRFRNGTNKPKCWIDLTYDSGHGLPRLTDWGDSFANFYEDVSNHADAAALNFGSIVNYDDRGLRFGGGTRHIRIQQSPGFSGRHGFRLSDYTYDFSTSGSGVFSEHILVDITGTGSIQIDLARTRCEGSATMAANPAFVRVTDTVGPNAIGAKAVTLIYRGGGILHSGASGIYLVYHDTKQTGAGAPHTNIIIPNGVMLSNFVGLQGGNWNTTWKGTEPPFAAHTNLPPYVSPRAAGSTWPYMGQNPRFKGALQGDNGAQFITGGGNPEGIKSAAKGSVFLRTDGGAGFVLYYKTTGSEASPTNTGWVNMTYNSGAITATTDASGDVIVTHGLGGTPATVLAKASGTTLRHTMPHTFTASNFKVRFLDPAGAALVSTAVTGSWMAKA